MRTTTAATSARACGRTTSGGFAEPEASAARGLRRRRDRAVRGAEPLRVGPRRRVTPLGMPLPPLDDHAARLPVPLALVAPLELDEPAHHVAAAGRRLVE